MEAPAQPTRSTLGIRWSRRPNRRKRSSSRTGTACHEQMGVNDMRKTTCLICVVVVLRLLAMAQNERLFKYRAVEAYEIRPGILMMPRYSDSHEVCEIVLQRDHYLNETAHLGKTTYPRTPVTQSRRLRITGMFQFASSERRPPAVVLRGISLLSSAGTTGNAGSLQLRCARLLCPQVHRAGGPPFRS